MGERSNHQPTGQVFKKTNCHLIAISNKNNENSSPQTKMIMKLKDHSMINTSKYINKEKTNDLTSDTSI